MTVHRSKGSENVVQYPREGVQPATVVKVILVVGGLLLIPAGIGAGAGAFYFLHMGLAPSLIMSGGATTVGVSSLLIALAIHLAKQTKMGNTSPLTVPSQSDQTYPPQKTSILQSTTSQSESSQEKNPVSESSSESSSQSDPTYPPQKTSTLQSTTSQSEAPQEKHPVSKSVSPSAKILPPEKSNHPKEVRISKPRKIKEIVEYPFSLINDPELKLKNIPRLKNTYDTTSLPHLHFSIPQLARKAHINLTQNFEKWDDEPAFWKAYSTSRWICHDWTQTFTAEFIAISENPDSKQKLLEKFIKCEKKVQILENKGINPTWFTGNRSPVLIGLEKLISEDGEYILEPTGTLLNKNFAPFFGECHGGVYVNGGNQIYLSGVTPPYIEISIRYAEKKRYLVNLEEEITYIKNYDFLRKTIPRFKIAVLRLIQLSSHPLYTNQINLKKIKSDIESRFHNLTKQEQYIPGDQKEEIKKILQLFDEVNPIEFDTEKTNLLQDSFPILWSADLPLDKIKKFPMSGAGEGLVQKPLILGKDIRVAFTKKKDMPRLKGWLKDHGLEDSVIVLPMSVARYLYIRNKAKDYIETGEWKPD